ncbi:MAG: histidine kinase [Moheibacter sp.]
MEQKDIYLLIISAAATFLIFCISLIVLFFLFQKRRETYLKQITQIRIEVQEQTLKNISWEIHDNIGQILSAISLYSHSLIHNAPPEFKPKIQESQELIEKAIVEVRALSKALNTDYIKNIGLLESVKIELERFKRLKFMSTEFEIKGKPFRLNEEVELTILRILQEFFSNTLKHAKATRLEVVFEFAFNELKIRAEDNGLGYGKIEKPGTGLINMKNRAKVIGAFINFESEPGKGTRLILNYKTKLTKHEAN